MIPKKNDYYQQSFLIRWHLPPEICHHIVAEALSPIQAFNISTWGTLSSSSNMEILIICLLTQLALNVSCSPLYRAVQAVLLHTTLHSTCFFACLSMTEKNGNRVFILTPLYALTVNMNSSNVCCFISFMFVINKKTWDGNLELLPNSQIRVKI